MKSTSPSVSEESTDTTWRSLRWFLLASLFLSWNELRLHADETAVPEIDFSHQVVPILRQHCVPCHGGTVAKGGFSLNTRELLVASGHVEVGAPNESNLLELVGSDDVDSQMPPASQPRMPDDQQLLLRTWLKQGMTWENGFSFSGTPYEPPLLPRRPPLPPVVNGRAHPIDRIVDAYLLENRIEPLPTIDDETFIRRVSLDLVGLLPDPQTLQAFLKDPSQNKRERFIDKLLQDDIAYADHWLTFFNDLFRNDYSGTGFITGGRTQISDWLYNALATNKPFDAMARELLAPSDASRRGFIDGIKWRGEVSAGQTNEIQFAQSIAQSFLGINIKCASCHDSFIDRWTLDQAYGLAAIYADRPMEIHRCDTPTGRQAQAAWLFPTLGDIDPMAQRDVRLQQLAALMTDEKNGRFARTITNRLWYKMLGRGIVHPLDSMQGEPWNADLLDHLAVAFSDAGCDLKSTLRLITTSHAYQAATATQPSDRQALYTFHGPLAKRLTAEQFLDNVWQITGAAPTQFDAPINRSPGKAAPFTDNIQANWIWGPSASGGKTPPAGETITLRKRFKLLETVEAAGAVITCDNSFVLLLNGQELARGDDWSKPQAVRLADHFMEGENELRVVATNAGDAPNPAGLFFEARVQRTGQPAIRISTDETWEIATDPSNNEWAPATIVPAVSAWKQTTDAQAGAQLGLAMLGKMPMVRASLMKNNFLMKSLGRPLREQIVSMRPDEITTLEAIDLSNGPMFAEMLTHGARELHQQNWETPNDLVTFVFQSALCRNPVQAESELAVEFLSDEPRPQEIEDLLWAVFMMPEFILVR